jgi:hypothetical protein
MVLTKLEIWRLYRNLVKSRYFYGVNLIRTDMVNGTKGWRSIFPLSRRGHVHALNNKGRLILFAGGQIK